MINKPPQEQKDYLTALLTSAVGAGIVTSFAVSQGQHPLLAFSITIVASLFAVICHRFGII